MYSSTSIVTGMGQFTIDAHCNRKNLRTPKKR